MKVLIVGYGNMGKEVELILKQRNHEITARVDPMGNDGDTRELTPELAGRADIAIEFSLSNAVPVNADIYAGAKLPAVIGTTGWDAERDKIRNLIESNDGSLIWGSNFSMGAHILFALTEKITRIADKLPDYDIMAYEIHHKGKKDSPSGTALRIGERILKNTDRKTKIVTDKLDRKIENTELHIASVRGGAIPGIHTVLLDSPADTIEIRHTARTRSGFALGAVLAAEWLLNKTGFFGVEDFINDFLEEG